MTAPEETPRFINYTPRRVGALHRGYSLFVSVLKFTLPLVALVLLGVLFTRLSDSGQPQTETAALPAAEKTTPGQIELVQPKYEGVDEENRAYTVTAENAVRDDAAPDTVVFTRPEADIILSDGSWLAAKAEAGVFDRQSSSLVLKDGVSIFHDSGYELKTGEIKIDLKTKTAEGKSAVHIQGPMGAIDATSVSVREQGNLIVFGGPATLTLFKFSTGKARG